jgi:DNA invertase Pin-like site-specific DNA recombinase
MLAAAQRPEHPFSFVIVYDVKRFGRVDNDEAGYYRHILRTHGVEVLYVSENFSGDGTDDLLRPVKQWQAREESKDLSKVTIRGLLSKVPGGWWMGGAPPYGYDLRYVNDRGTTGEFLFVLRFMPDGTKQMLDEDGGLVRTLDRRASINVSKRDRARLVPSSPDTRRANQKHPSVCGARGH